MVSVGWSDLSGAFVHDGLLYGPREGFWGLEVKARTTHEQLQPPLGSLPPDGVSAPPRCTAASPSSRFLIGAKDLCREQGIIYLGNVDSSNDPIRRDPPSRLSVGCP